MLSHIVIPLDGSPLAEEALFEARRIMAPGTRITLLTVVQEPSLPIYGYELAVSLAASYQSELEEAISKAKGYLEQIAESLRSAGFSVSLIAEFGDDPAGIIVDTARNLHVDAIVISTHGRSGISRWLFGSVTSKVLSARACPVFVIRSGVRVRASTEEAAETYYG